MKENKITVTIREEFVEKYGANAIISFEFVGTDTEALNVKSRLYDEIFEFPFIESRFKIDENTIGFALNDTLVPTFFEMLREILKC